MDRMKVILDVDTGVDDALALLFAARSPEFDILGIGVVAGNVEVEVGTLNTLRVMEKAGAGHVPVAAGAPKPMLQPLGEAKWVHGEDGLGNTNLPAPKGKPTGEHAADQIIRLAKQYPGEITLIAVGPLTNLGLALLKEPELPKLIKKVIIMGGAVAFGNRTAVAEANIANDPDAAALVFDAGWDLTMIGLDVTHAAYATQEHYDMLKNGGEIGQFAAAVYKEYFELMCSLFGRPYSPLHDPLAFAVAIDPTLVEAPLLRVDVETQGKFTRGMTVADMRHDIAGRLGDGHKPNVRVGLKVDRERFLELFFGRLVG